MGASTSNAGDAFTLGICHPVLPLATERRGDGGKRT